MAQTRIKLKQLKYAIIGVDGSLFIPDVVKSGKIEFLLPDERLGGKVDQPQVFGGREVTAIVKPIPKKSFKVLNLDDSEIGIADSMDKAIELFLEVHPHFNKESIKTFIYETD